MLQAPSRGGPGLPGRHPQAPGRRRAPGRAAPSSHLRGSQGRQRPPRELGGAAALPGPGPREEKPPGRACPPGGASDPISAPPRRAGKATQPLKMASRRCPARSRAARSRERREKDLGFLVKRSFPGARRRPRAAPPGRFPPAPATGAARGRRGGLPAPRVPAPTENSPDRPQKRSPLPPRSEALARAGAALVRLKSLASQKRDVDGG